MRVIPPITVTPAMLTSSSVSEPSSGESTWSNTTYYKLGDRVIDTTTHRTYESQSGAQAVVTVTIASPGVFTWLNHGLPAGTPVYLTTTGALPTGLTANTRYYVVEDTVDTFKLSSTIGGAAINTSGSQSGIHTATANPNRGHAPTTDDGTWWVDVGPTNKWAMFDLLRNTASVGTTTLTATVTPGQNFDTVGLVGISGESVDITVTVGGSPTFTQTVDLLNRPVIDWYGYFFSSFDYRENAIVPDIPVNSSSVLTVTVHRAAGSAALGGLVIGMSVYIGRTLHGAEHEGLNFSRIERDQYGNVVLIPRRTVPKTAQTIRVDKANVPRLLLLIEQLNAVPALWWGIDDELSGYFTALLILGVYKRFAINMDQPEEALVTLELEEI